jgi:mono/diheme cytochrome c family protein
LTNSVKWRIKEKSKTTRLSLWRKCHRPGHSSGMQPENCMVGKAQSYLTRNKSKIVKLDMKSMILAVVLCLAALLATTACSSGSTLTSAPPASSSTPVINANAIYNAKCASCHGADRQGTTNLAPALTAESLSGKTDAKLTDAITNGVPETAMPRLKASSAPARLPPWLSSLSRLSQPGTGGCLTYDSQKEL